MAETEQQLIRKRGVLKAKLTSFTTFLKQLESLDGIIENTKYLELQTRFNRIENIICEFDKLQENLDIMTNNYEEQLKERDIFESLYYDLIARAKSILQNTSRTQDNDSINQNNTNLHLAEDGSTGTSNRINNNMKLPQIHLPKFSGKYENWLEFRDTFQSLIHCNDSLDSVQKFHYLRAALEDGAAQVIRSIEFSAHNYTVAWGVLCERFNNTTLLVHNHVKALFDIQALAKESAHDIRNLIDNLTKHLRSLNNLGEPTQHWDTLIIFIITKKLDKLTSREWEEKKKRDSIPTLEDLKTFLKNRADLLETLETKKTDSQPFKRETHSKNNYSFLSSKQSCGFCNGGHYIFNCPEFLKMAIPSRIEKVKRIKLCINCLKPGHIAKDCTSGKCKICMGKHNTLLHIPRDTKPTHENDQGVALSAQNSKLQQVLLATALVQITDSKGYPRTCRTILDSGSQSNFMTSRMCSGLGLEKIPIKLSIIGINRSVSKITHKCTFTLQSLHNSYEKEITCLILDSIVDDLPELSVDATSLGIPTHLRLADPGFSKSGRIDLLIGNDLFWQLLCIGQHNLGKDKPILQKTKLGWIVSGNMGSKSSQTEIHCNISRNQSLHEQLEKFWMLDSFEERTPMSQEDYKCEDIFNKSVERSASGRFIVKLPLKDPVSALGDSKHMAMTRFASLENKFKYNKVLMEDYVQFMSEYEQLEHMSECIMESEEITYFLPHHGVHNPNSNTTKLRVVFDGSAKTDTGISLNDIMYRGPNIQEDLVSIIFRFRQWRFVICGDIKKMYRQILVANDQRRLQTILWRKKKDEPIKAFSLNTVTYGTKAAPYLAVRCLKQLAYEYQEQEPEAARTISSDFYVDDLITGGNTIDETITKAKSICKILASGGFELHKWGSNESNILNQLEATSQTNLLHFESNDTKRTVGLYWGCTQDTLQFSIQEMTNQRVTKRTILSDIAHIYDPLGLLSPSIIVAKIILQSLWASKLTWDENIPADVYTKWRTFRKELPRLNELQLPRYVVGNDALRIELHGFADASQSAYGACIYMRTETVTGKFVTNLFCAKTRVAPLKPTTIPRLELCSALLMARLVMKTQKTSQIKFDKTYLWSDSSITLHWIHTPANLLQPFVGNRIEHIQAITKQNDWHHVRSHHNPADLLSRGISPNELLQSKFWWQGPSWLNRPCNEWPESIIQFSSKPPELRKQTRVLAVLQHNSDIFHRFSKLERLNRVVAYCLRFAHNCRKLQSNRTIGPMTYTEISKASSSLIKLCQQESFETELKLLTRQQETNKKSKLHKLNPILDEEGIIRVGGRLQYSNFEYEKKHPVVLPKMHKFTRLILESEHRKMGHAAPQLLLASIREHFWPIGGRSLARSVVHQCIRCCKTKPVHISPIMGILPKQRVTPSLPFTSTGIDYAGPFLIKDRNGRGARVSKCYICLFVCFTTRAIHLELVTDLSKDAFLATFSRFTARRGIPSHIFSDNGKNFVAAQKELKELSTYLELHENFLVDRLASQGISWHFIPTYAPHFGGLWEAGVKATKYHLKRIVGNEKLTFEQLYTVLTSIEAILNSRPLTPLSSDPNDFHALTPSHFLIGKRLLTITNPSIPKMIPCKMSKWEHIQQLRQHFWSRWSKEYVAELQMRQKWATSQGHLEKNTLVVIKDDNVPPLQWKLGRIVELHPGGDGISRVATIKTQTGMIKRAFSKICPLPVQETEI